MVILHAVQNLQVILCNRLHKTKKNKSDNNSPTSHLTAQKTPCRKGVTSDEVFTKHLHNIS